MLSDQQRVCIETCLRTTSLATAIDALHRFFPQFNIVFKRLVDVDDRTGKKIDRFGGWDGKIITLNPEKGKDNPLEIVDTLAHEIVHALCSTTPDLKNLLLPPGADLNTDPHLPLRGTRPLPKPWWAPPTPTNPTRGWSTSRAFTGRRIPTRTTSSSTSTSRRKCGWRRSVPPP